MFKEIKKEHQRKKRIAELRQFIDKTIEEQLKNAQNSQDEDDAYQRSYAMLRKEYNESDYLRQKPYVDRLRDEGVQIDEAYWCASVQGEKKTLTADGENWVRGEAKRLWRSNIEFWAKLALPIVSLVLSIIAIAEKSSSK